MSHRGYQTTMVVPQSRGYDDVLEQLQTPPDNALKSKEFSFQSQNTWRLKDQEARFVTDSWRAKIISTEKNPENKKDKTIKLKSYGRFKPTLPKTIIRGSPMKEVTTLSARQNNQNK